MPDKEFDVVIIGSGLGGLLCGYLLAEEGRSVCILEKNAQIGGNLQTFKRDRIKFDSGVHYVGGLEPGQALYPFFKYFDLLDHLESERLDSHGYDLISFEGDQITYPHAQGYENFIVRLLEHFPDEEAGLREYCARIQETCRLFEWYTLSINRSEQNEMNTFDKSAKEVIASCTSNVRLQQVLAGSNLLYAGDGDSSPFYIHALIIDSYINSAYKLKNSDLIAKKLRKDIKRMGGKILINKEVVRIDNDQKQVHAVYTADGAAFYAKDFISNIHPTKTFSLLNTEGMRKVNVNRMMNLENTTAAFILYIKLKPGTLRYLNSNRYHFIDPDVWTAHQYDEDRWIKAFALFNSRAGEDSEYADTLTVMAYMNYREVRQWENTFNTTLQESIRDTAYQKFKARKSELLIDAVEKIIPNLRDKVESYHSATPLTQRDYIGSIEGGLYGIKRDYHSPAKSFIGASTKLNNLYLTGQNVILHGILGVTISAMVTCQYFFGKEYLMGKIKSKAKE